MISDNYFYFHTPCTRKSFVFSFSNFLQISVNCEFDEWEEWTQCTATCNGGTRFRTRGIKVAAAYGGAECDGDIKEEETCNNQPCPGTWKSQLCINASTIVT